MTLCLGFLGVCRSPRTAGSLEEWSTEEFADAQLNHCCLSCSDGFLLRPLLSLVSCGCKNLLQGQILSAASASSFYYYLTAVPETSLGMEQSWRAGLKAGVEKGRLNNTKCTQVVMESKEEWSSVSPEKEIGILDWEEAAHGQAGTKIQKLVG